MLDAYLDLQFAEYKWQRKILFVRMVGISELTTKQTITTSVQTAFAQKDGVA
jgi:hypothetical protein